MRIVAILAVYNEARFIGACLDNLLAQGVETYLIDNGSTDETTAIAERYLKRGLIGIESFPRDGIYSWQPLLARKEELACELDADWFMHADADEIRLPPRSTLTLAEALAAVDEQGYNAVNFMEYTFIPTLESPDHDHPDFQKTMRWYYPFLPEFPNRLNAWKRQTERVDLVTLGGHVVSFPDLRMYPESFPMRHYLFLSLEHAASKFLQRKYDPEEVAAGFHQARARLTKDAIRVPSQALLRYYLSDDQLDPSNPRSRHYLFDSDW